MLHIVKLCVGVATIDELAAYQTAWLAEQRAAGLTPRIFHRTLQKPRRRDEVLDQGSLYWVVKGMITARQRIIGLEEAQRADGAACCDIVMDPEIVLVCPTPRRAFQGWRYLTPEDAPPDRTSGRGDQLGSCPPEMRRDLTELCLI